jgi:hypothetical protein
VKAAERAGNKIPTAVILLACNKNEIQVIVLMATQVGIDWPVSCILPLF